MGALNRRAGRKAEIMFVEDNHGDELLALRAFRNGQIENHFTFAGSGEQAWSMLRGVGVYAGQALPDIILLDIRLPQMSGLALLEMIKNDARLKHIPVIIMSSSESADDVRRSYDLHASGYIIKPMDIEAFKEAVAAIEHYFFMLVVLPRPLATHAEDNGQFRA